ncbi:ATP-binding protein [Sphingomonas floccifaciens]|uniref:histidine kinase n=1 Tax=Sphingomonas floccifaciens TaxID=1844115 RepID=A0ABW4NEL2_9SPHN
MFAHLTCELLSIAEDPALVIGPDLTFTYLNEPAKHEFAKLGLLGRGLADAPIGKDWEAIRHVCEQSRGIGPGRRFETCIPLLENWYEVRAVGVQGHHVLLLSDITGQRRASRDELTPPAASTLLKTIIDSAPDLIFVKDMAGRFILVNRALRDVSPDLLGRTVHDIYDADLAAVYDAADRSVIESGRPCTVEEIIPVHGEQRVFQTIKVPWIVGSDMRGVIGISRDMTERHNAEARVRESEERYRLAARATKDAIWDWDLIRDEITWNEAIEHLAGERPDQTGDWWKSRIAPADRDRVLGSIGRFIRQEISTWQCEYEFRHADGSYHAVFDRGFLVRDAHGVPVRMIGAMSDLSEPMKAQRRVMQLQSELIHVSRVSAMGTIASALAHEINQPLASAGNYVAGARRLLLGDDPNDLHEAREALALAASEVSRSGEIVRRIRRMVAHGETQVQPVPLKELIDDALALALPNPALSGVRVDLGPRHGVARGDAVQLQQVLVNLMRNAVEAMEDTDDRVLRLATSGDDASVRIDVRDTGCGIPSERVATVFTAFGSSKIGGLGVGLTICRTIVEAHGGQIWVEQTDDSGTCVALRLPSHRGDATP